MKPFGKDVLNVIFCDNHILVVDKPGNLLTQKDSSGRPSLEEKAKQWVKEKFQKKGLVFLHCIHRLDRPASGLVLFARTSKALSRLNAMSRDQEIRRFYIANVEGHLQKKQGKLEHFLEHSDHFASVSHSKNPNAKQAVLSYAVVKENKHSTCVKIELETGRYHQIRAQFAAIHHPIVGDKRYGATSGDGSVIDLCCSDLFFLHPVTQQELAFHSEFFF